MKRTISVGITSDNFTSISLYNITFLKHYSLMIPIIERLLKFKAISTAVCSDYFITQINALPKISSYIFPIYTANNKSYLSLLNGKHGLMAFSNISRTQLNLKINSI